MASDTRVPARTTAGRKNASRSDHGNDESSAACAAAPAKQTSSQPGSTRSLARLLKTLREFALILDSDGIVQNFWSSNRSHLSKLENALLGRRLQDLVSDQTFGQITQMMRDASESGQSIYESQPATFADGEHSFSVSVTPMAAKPGGPKMICLLARDLTPWMASREALLVRESLLAQAEELANVGSWELDLETGAANWSVHFFRMLGLPPERGPMPRGRGMAMVHPDDRERALRDSEMLRKEGKPFDTDLRVMTAHRGVRNFHSRAIAMRDGKGRVVRIRGMSQDVTEQREAEEKLREREALFAHAEKIANIGSWQTNLVTHESRGSPNLRKILGVSPDCKLTPAHFWNRVHPEDLAGAQEITSRATEEGTLFEYEARYLPPQGGIRFLHIRGVATLDTAGKPLGRTGVVQDITEQREGEEKLREREALLAHAEEIANLGSFQYDVATRKGILSPNLRKIFGLCDGEEWNREACWERVHPQDRDWARESMARGTQSGKPFAFVMRFTPPGGAMRHLQVRGSPQVESTGKVTHLIGVVQDITEHREIEESLRERQALLAHAEHVASFGSWQLDLATDRVTLSPYLMEYYGLTTADNWTRELLWSRVHPEDRAWAQQTMKQATEEKRSFDFVARCLPPGGGVRFVRFRGEPILDAEGKPARRVGVVQDITDQREAEEKRREREALLAQAEQIANFGSWKYDFVTGKTTLSPHLMEIYGLTTDAGWTPDHFWSRIHPEDRGLAQEAVRQATEEKKPFDRIARYLPPEGGVRFVRFRGVPILDSAGRLVRRVGVAQDITEQREAEEKLRERSAMLEYAEKVAKLGSWRYDYATDSFILSPNMRRILGIGPDDSWSSELYWSRVHPADRAQAQAIFERATAERKPFEFILRFAPMNGGMAHLCTRGITFCDASGKPTHRVGVVQDITEQVRAEEELRGLSQQLLRARDDDRRHIARELHESAGQSLAALKMTLGRLRDVLEENPDSARALLQSAVELADSAVREVRTVSYLMHPPMLDDAGLAPALRWYARGFAERSGIRVDVDLPKNMPRQSQEIETTIFRIVQEALTNVHRYSGSRTAQIRVACHKGAISAEVSDEGCGLPPPRRAWGSPESLGVGIAGMRERVKQLNGTFELESAPGKGTTVRVALPITAKPAENFLGSQEESRRSGKARPNGA